MKGGLLNDAKVGYGAVLLNSRTGGATFVNADRRWEMKLSENAVLRRGNKRLREKKRGI